MPLPTIPPPFDVILKFPRLDPQAIYFFFFKPHLERGGPLRKKKKGWRPQRSPKVWRQPGVQRMFERLPTGFGRNNNGEVGENREGNSTMMMTTTTTAHTKKNRKKLGGPQKSLLMSRGQLIDQTRDLHRQFVVVLGDRKWKLSLISQEAYANQRQSIAA